MTHRNCQACGVDCQGKRVWEKYGSRKVICYTCGATHTFNANGDLIDKPAKRTQYLASRREVA